MAGKRKAASLYSGKKRMVFHRNKYAVTGPTRSAPAASRGFYGAQSRLKRQLQGIMERKLVDTASASYALDTTGSVTLINGCAQGSDFTNRIGRKYSNVAVQLEGLALLTAVAAGPLKYRIMLIYDAQPNGALPAITDVLTASTSRAFMNLNNRDRFKVICDLNDVLGLTDIGANAAAADTTVKNVSVYKKINLETICDGTTAAIGDIQTGSLLLLTIADLAAGAAGSFRGAVRVRFTDA